MNQISIKIHNENQMKELGKTIIKVAYPNLVIALVGDLGAGKTTLTKGIGEALGIKKVINSPTFTIMKIYDASHPTIKKLYHLDVYRLTSSDSDFELEEYFYLDGLTVIEWAHIIDDIIPQNTWEFEIIDLGNNERQVNIICSQDLIEEIGEEKYEIIHR